MEESKNDKHHMYIQDTHGIEITRETKVIKFDNLNEDVINLLILENIDTVDTNNVSDGYHTFGELYEHRIQNFITLCRTISNLRAYVQGLLQQPGDMTKFAWMSTLHSDGTNYEGWFILGLGMEKGEQITYHLPISKWEECAKFAQKLDKAPEFDGHTSQDVLDRLKNLVW